MNNTSSTSSNVTTKSNYKIIYKSLLIIAMAVLAVITIFASQDGGPVNILKNAFDSAAGLQLFVDLFVALSLVMVWMWFDAKKRGKNALPWILLTLAVGSFGPLLYLLFRKDK